MASLGRGILIGAGGALGLCSQTESMNDIPRTILRGALSGYDKISVNHNSHTNSNTTTSPSDGMSLQMQHMANEIRDLKLARNSTDKLVIYGSNSGAGWTTYTIGVVAATGAVVAWYKGYSLGDIMYLTKGKFTEAMDTVEQKFGEVYDKLEETKESILAKVNGVDQRVQTARKVLEERIEESCAGVEKKVDKLAIRFGELENGQQQLLKDSDGHTVFFEQLHVKMGENKNMLNRVAGGVALLVKSVLSLDVANNDKSALEDYLAIEGPGQSLLEDNSRSNNVTAEVVMPKSALSKGLRGLKRTGTVN